MADLLAMMVASAEVAALPVGVRWPVHRALCALAEDHAVLAVSSAPDPDVFVRVDGADEALQALIERGLLEKTGSGYTARWVVQPYAIPAARRALLREEPSTAAVITQVGQRLATWASTALKNVDNAASSWASQVASPTPTVRQPPLVALR